MADSYFAIFEFVDGLAREGFHIVSRFRSNAALMYLHEGEPTGKKGRPRKYDGKIDFDNLDMGKFSQVHIYADEGGFYTAIVYSKSLKRNVRLVVFQPKDGKHILYFSTDTDMSAKDVVEYYRTRFQIEFCYRDGKQFAGLCDCQARDFAKLDFAFNASLTAVNVAKVVIREHYPTFSMANLKSLLYNAYIMNRFFIMSGFRPNVAETECKAKLA
ncbi:MAG: transposase [Bacteroidales bacterium]|nr:transposase [Bacteroidales bacterium]